MTRRAAESGGQVTFARQTQPAMRKNRSYLPVDPFSGSQSAKGGIRTSAWIDLAAAREDGFAGRLDLDLRHIETVFASLLLPLLGGSGGGLGRAKNLRANRFGKTQSAHVHLLVRVLASSSRFDVFRFPSCDSRACRSLRMAE